jgi:hypothetical protein
MGRLIAIIIKHIDELLQGQQKEQEEYVGDSAIQLKGNQ